MNNSYVIDRNPQWVRPEHFLQVVQCKRAMMIRFLLYINLKFQRKHPGLKKKSKRGKFGTIYMKHSEKYKKYNQIQVDYLIINLRQKEKKRT